MMKCDDILKYVDQYWTMDDNNLTKIEIEAHLCDCEHCANLFDLGMFSSHQSSTWSDNSDFSMTADGVRVTNNVMDRIYEENDWAMPVYKRKYQFTQSFKRNIAIIISASLTMLFIAMFTFLSQDGHVSSNKIEASQSGVIDVGVAKSSTQSIDILSEHVAVASLTDPIVMKAVPTYSHYYIALSIIAIIGTLLILNWFSRTKQ